jgi:hypothetical protein
MNKPAREYKVGDRVVYHEFNHVSGIPYGNKKEGTVVCKYTESGLYKGHAAWTVLFTTGGWIGQEVPVWGLYLDPLYQILEYDPAQQADTDEDI